VKSDEGCTIPEIGSELLEQMHFWFWHKSQRALCTIAKHECWLCSSIQSTLRVIRPSLPRILAAVRTTAPLPVRNWISTVGPVLLIQYPSPIYSQRSLAEAAVVLPIKSWTGSLEKKQVLSKSKCKIPA
jgi:hypothetical protein